MHFPQNFRSFERQHARICSAFIADEEEEEEAGGKRAEYQQVCDRGGVVRSFDRSSSDRANNPVFHSLSLSPSVCLCLTDCHVRSKNLTTAGLSHCCDGFANSTAIERLQRTCRHTCMHANLSKSVIRQRRHCNTRLSDSFEFPTTVSSKYVPLSRLNVTDCLRTVPNEFP